MFPFLVPPATRYDLQFSIAGFPVRVHPLFWLVAIFLGSASNDLLQILMWVVVVFVSILVHELGHALAFNRYGQRSYIVLHFAGGLTVPTGAGGYSSAGLRPGDWIFISLAGPFAGFIFAALVVAGVQLSGGLIEKANLFGVIPLPDLARLPFGGDALSVFATMLLWVNIRWGLINLLPVYPLDGGNVTRNFLLILDPRDGVRKSLWISVITGGLLAASGLFPRPNWFIVFLFGMLAFQSYQMLRGRY